MLAYVFWHTSRVEQSLQEANLAAFHETLAANPPEGFIRSAVFSCESLPWTPDGPTAYEDWYLIEDFAALGRLNEAAVKAPREKAHNAAAKGADWGAGGLYALHRGSAMLEAHRYATWASKPEGVSYEEFYTSLPGDAEIWRRQLVLSRGPEFCMRGSRPLEVPHGVVRELRAIWTGS